MKIGIWLSLVALVLVSQIQECVSIWCYSCHSFSEPACGDEFRLGSGNHQARSQCDGPSSCVKRRGKRKYSEGVSKVEVERTCIPRRPEGCYTESKYGIEQYSCSCNSNFCNSSPRIISKSTNTILLSVVFTSLLYLGQKHLFSWH